MFSDEDFLARRQLEREMIDEGTLVWKQKKEMDAVRDMEDRRQLRMMLKTYNPWGKPGHGAPVPGAVRKTKLILDTPQVSDSPTSVLTMGRPGHGAPLRTPSGRNKASVHCDPSIRFQFTEQSRRSVDNELRYRSTIEEKENYRKQLDALIKQKSQERKGRAETPVGLQRAKQGWSNEVTLKRLQQQEAEQTFEISGGVELVPLLARHRGQSSRRTLPTTDITRISRLQNGPPKTTQSEMMYHTELSSQVNQRQQKMMIWEWHHDLLN